MSSGLSVNETLIELNTMFRKLNEMLNLVLVTILFDV